MTRVMIDLKAPQPERSPSASQPAAPHKLVWHDLLTNVSDVDMSSNACKHIHHQQTILTIITAVFLHAPPHRI